jgi:hypothetical protein
VLICVSKTGWQNLATRERNIMTYAASQVQLGHPAIMVATDDSRWFTFHDRRISIVDVAWFGCFAANAAEMAASDYVPPADQDVMRAEVRVWLMSPARDNPFVHPDDITPSDPDGGLTSEEVLAAQGAPAAIKGSLDPTWVPYDPELHGDP